MKMYTIVGPGAVGSYIAYKLKKSGNNVCLVDYKESRTGRLNKNGISLVAGDEKDTVTVDTHNGLYYAGEKNVCLICVKSYSIEDYLRNTYKKLMEFKAVIIIQNGILWLELLPELLGDFPAGGGVGYFGVTKVEEGVVRFAGEGPLYIGPLDNAFSGIFGEIAGELSSAGVDTVSSREIRKVVWKKLIVNLGINPLTVLYDCKNGGLLDGGDREKNLERVVHEGIAVAGKEGMLFKGDEMIAATKETCRKTAENISSMLQDVKKGKKTEIESITGALLQMAVKHGMDVPENNTVYKRVKEIMGDRER